MPERTLRQALQDVQDALHAAGDVDAETVELLHDVVDDIHRVLERTEEAAQPPPQLRAEVGGLAMRLETDHPALTRALNRISEALAAMGI